MKLVAGRTLAELLADRPDPSADLPRFVAAFEKVCEAAAFAHSKGVVHRDLKPSNVMVGAFGEVQVMDWGLAKDLASGGRQPPEEAVAPPDRSAPTRGADAPRSPEPSHRTQPGSVLGTPAFMPPEQAGGETDKVDERADVFGLGAVLCTILTGKPPYAAYCHASSGWRQNWRRNVPAVTTTAGMFRAGPRAPRGTRARSLAARVPRCRAPR